MADLLKFRTRVAHVFEQVAVLNQREPQQRVNKTLVVEAVPQACPQRGEQREHGSLAPVRAVEEVERACQASFGEIDRKGWRMLGDVSG